MVNVVLQMRFYFFTYLIFWVWDVISECLMVLLIRVNRCVLELTAGVPLDPFKESGVVQGRARGSWSSTKWRWTGRLLLVLWPVVLKKLLEIRLRFGFSVHWLVNYPRGRNTLVSFVLPGPIWSPFSFLKRAPPLYCDLTALQNLKLLF